MKLEETLANLLENIEKVICELEEGRSDGGAALMTLVWKQFFTLQSLETWKNLGDQSLDLEFIVRSVEDCVKGDPGTDLDQAIADLKNFRAKYRI